MIFFLILIQFYVEHSRMAVNIFFFTPYTEHTECSVIEKHKQKIRKFPENCIFFSCEHVREKVDIYMI